MGSRFCPKCGSTEGPFIKRLCKKCFFEKNSLFELPRKISIEKCAACGRIRAFGKWVPEEEKILAKIIEKHAKLSKIDLEEKSVDFSFVPKREGIIAIPVIKAKMDSVPVEEKKETLLEFANARCDSCMKAVSNYHEAVIQLRFEKKAGEQILEEIEKILSASSKKDLLAKIISIQRQKQGIDILIGSNKSASQAAKIIAKKYNVKIVVSFKQVKGGTRDRTKKRFTYCLRI